MQSTLIQQHFATLKQQRDTLYNDQELDLTKKYESMLKETIQ